MEVTAPPPGVGNADRGRAGHAEGWRAGTGDGHDPDRHVHVVLLGLPGVGTSTIGRLLAHELRRPYVDHDSVVGLGSGDDVETLRRVLATHGSVVYGVGGQVVERIRADDLADAFVVWLDATPEVVVDRLGSREHPVLGADPLRSLSELAERVETQVGELADLRIPVGDADADEVTDQIHRAWRRHVAESEAAT